MAVYKKNAETRQKIIDATIEMVRKDGYKGFSIKELSDYMDVPRSLAYYYYKNKEDIMHDLYRMRFADISAVTDTLTTEDTTPIVRLMLGYILFKRFLILDPLFTEFILTYPTFASLGPQALDNTISEFYQDSFAAFEYYNIPTDDNRLKEHVIAIDALSRALNQGVYNGTLHFTLEEIMIYLSERTIMITFDLSKEELMEILDEAFALANRIKSVKSTYIVESTETRTSAGSA